jgi:hypothetical protein
VVVVAVAAAMAVEVVVVVNYPVYSYNLMIQSIF